ncbi:MAG: DUF559 domain-containing protein [Leucobacter sp.]
MHRQLFLAHGPVLRSAFLLEHGATRHELARAVDAGRLIRVRKGWLALPNADPALLFAAREGVVLSCITSLHRAGVWVHDPAIPHLAVPRPGAEHRPPRAVLHYHRPVVPRAPFALEDPIEIALVLAAYCQPHEHAVATWDSALNKKLVDRAVLERLPLTRRARAVLDATDPFADSGLETYVRQRLRRFGLRVIGQPYILGHHVDLLIGSRLVIQIDGSTHTGRQRDEDNAHDALLMLHGYTVIRVGYRQIMNSWPEVQHLIMQAVAQGKHLAA